MSSNVMGMMMIRETLINRVNFWFRETFIISIIFGMILLVIYLIKHHK